MSAPTTKAQARYQLAVLETKTILAARAADTLTRAGATAVVVHPHREAARLHSEAMSRVWALLDHLPE